MAEQTVQENTQREQDLTQSTKYVGLKEQMAFNLSAFFRDMSYALMGRTSYFFVEVLGLRRGWLGGLMLARQLWDGINDPLMGAYFDKRAFQDEKARRYFKTTGIPIAVLLVLMFLPLRFSSNPTTNGWMIMGFLMLCYIPFEAMHTINGTSYMSYYNSITPNIQERSGIISRARLFSTMGTAVIAGGHPLLLDFFAPDDIRAKKFIFAGLAAGVALVFVLYNFLMYTQVKERIVSPPQEQQKILSIFRGMLKNKLFLIMMLSSTIGALINSGNTSTWFYQYNIGGTKWEPIVGIMGLPTLLLATWMIPWLCRRFEKRNIVLVCGLLQILINLAFLAVGYKSIPYLLFNSFISALPGNIKGPLYWSMMADSVDYQEWKTGKRNDGTIYAVEGFLAKLVGSVGAISTSIIIEVIHFEENAPVQSPETMQGLFRVPLIIGMISTVCAMVPYLFYNLKREEHARMIEEVKQRMELKEAEAVL
ncbi:MAG: MFS transporter [Oscillospiraceae bacterium]|nr:MFS transporter [Oscillospiraceae bacterium]